MEHVVDEEALVAVVNFDSNFVKPMDDVAVAVVVDCGCRPEMEYVVDEEALVAAVNCRCLMEIVVEATVSDANNCALVVLVVAFGNSKDLELEFVVDFAKKSFVAVALGVVVFVVVEVLEFEIEGFEEFE